MHRAIGVIALLLVSLTLSTLASSTENESAQFVTPHFVDDLHLDHEAKPVATESKPAVLRIDLAKHSVDDEDRAKILLAVKLRQTQYSSMLEMGNIPLKQEVLKEKHLATYYGTVKVGETDFRMLFDTGSCEFWVPSTGCKTARCMRHRRYPVDSMRFKQVHRRAGHMNIQYLSGKVAGDLVHERVQVGDVVIKDQVVGVANQVDIVLLDDVVWDGIIGMAYPNKEMSRANVRPLFDTIMRSRVLSSKGLANQFAYYIDDHKGALTLGGVDCDLLRNGLKDKDCIKQFAFVPVTKKGYWTVTLKDVRVKYPGRKEMKGFCAHGRGCQAIVDTGTYLTYYPATHGRFLNGFGNLCVNQKKLPVFHFDFKVKKGQKPVTLTLRPVDYVLKFKVKKSDDCVVGISPDRDTIWTLGQVFLRSFYTVFDRDSNRIGFARLPRSEIGLIDNGAQ